MINRVFSCSVFGNYKNAKFAMFLKTFLKFARFKNKALEQLLESVCVCAGEV